MKTPALLIKPDIARHHAENQAASLLRIAIIRRGVDVEPDVVHVGEVAAELFDHLVAFALGAESRAFHHFKFFKLGTMFQDHVEIRVEAAGGDDHGFTVDFERFAAPRRSDAADTAILRQQFACFGRGHDRDIRQRLRRS